ncbi:MAG: hypothetical protein RIR59_37 [Pseudomonadota bacterium]|jgi:DNA-binding transcriptional MerR regulator
MVDKAPGAFLTIGELSAELGVPQHILRYWETRFPKLRPLTRAGNRRYYRPEDVALVRRIHQLLNIEGYTVKGVQKLLSGKAAGPDDIDPAAEPAKPIPAHRATPVPPLPAAEIVAPPPPPSFIPDLVLIRDRLKTALAADGR